ncbi:MAG: hypothetical protein J6O61_15995 [Butyrivibrio sp.]|uniref:hypothetical protein n=1 Tax=Butyrivibrio sp. TaxID=28121 RepID=UPI001B0828AB|nr:hypothetical protein [Butyrivibrio sp.]MBO6242306.1 hypothetical protein [Butyrivibrio sp.]
MMVNENEHQGVSRILEAVLRERKAKLSNPNGSVIEVNYSALDLLKLFMESNYGKSDFIGIAAEMSKRALENKTDKDMYWRYATLVNAAPGMLEKNAVQELVNLLRAYELIDCGQDGLFFVTEEGKNVVNKAIILMDQVKIESVSTQS